MSNSRLRRLSRLEAAQVVRSDVKNVIIMGHSSAGRITSLKSQHGLFTRGPDEPEEAFFSRAYSHARDAQGVTLWVASHE